MNIEKLFLINSQGTGLLKYYVNQYYTKITDFQYIINKIVEFWFQKNKVCNVFDKKIEILCAYIKKELVLF